MTYVITGLCIGVKDKTCVDECPVDCIHEGERMLHIRSDECVDCGARRRTSEQVTAMRYRLEVRLTRPTSVGGSLSAGADPAQMMASRSPTSWAFSRSMTAIPSRSAPVTADWS